MSLHRYCDGLRRRDFLASGLLSGMGLTLSGYLRMAAAGEVAESRARSAILVWLGGGPTHMDTFDLKPKAGAEYRGEVNPIATNVPGIEISEYLPKLAQTADKFMILRGLSHTLAAHELGTKYMSTGNRPIPSIEYPGYGSVVAKELSADPELPPNVAIPTTNQSAGFLGVQYAALQTNGVPQPGQPFKMRGLSLPGGVTVADLERRQRLLGDLDTGFKGFDQKNEVLSGLDRFSEQADSILSSSRARDAFDVSRESPDIASRFGSSPFGQSCLLATRLIEAGVRFTTVTFGGWDMHQNIFPNLKDIRLPSLDDGLSGLFHALSVKGMLSSTIVLVAGEFGRTPKINKNAGRDHWPRAMFSLLAGGGIKGGQVLGASDENGMGPAGDGYAPDDVAATFYHSLGIDFSKEYQTSSGRPIMIVRQGKVIQEAFA